jgi:hypothetical protein
MNSNFGLVQVIGSSPSLEFNGPVSILYTQCTALKSPRNLISPRGLSDRAVRFAYPGR